MGDQAQGRFKDRSHKAASGILHFTVVAVGGFVGSGGDVRLLTVTYGLAFASTVMQHMQSSHARQTSNLILRWATFSIAIAAMQNVMYAESKCNANLHVWLAAFGSIVYWEVIAVLLHRSMSATNNDPCPQPQTLYTISRLLRRVAAEWPERFLVLCFLLALWFVLVDTAAASACNTSPYIARLVGLVLNGDATDGVGTKVLSPVVRAVDWLVGRLNINDTKHREFMDATVLVVMSVLVIWALTVRLWPEVDRRWSSAEKRVGQATGDLKVKGR